MQNDFDNSHVRKSGMCLFHLNSFGIVRTGDTRLGKKWLTGDSVLKKFTTANLDISPGDCANTL